MEAVAPRPQTGTLLSSADLDRLERLRIRPAQRLTTRARGEHLGEKGGTSTEFCDYRDYSAGDDLRFLDWNIFSRLRRPYLKVFHREEERHAVIFVDASESMQFEGKLYRAKELAAAFGVLGLRGGERVSVHAPAARARFGPSISRVSIRPMLSFIEGIEGGGDQPIELGLEAFLKQHSGRGVVVLLSDFLTAGNLVRPLNLLAGAGLEIFAIQILGPSERDPSVQVNGDLRLVDSETAQSLDLSAAGDLLALYQDYRASHERNLAALCTQRGGRFLSTSSGEPLAAVLFDRLRRQNWIG